MYNEIGIWLFKQLSGYILGKGLDNLLANKKVSEKRFQQLYDKTVIDYKNTYGITSPPKGKYHFTGSEKFISELICYRLSPNYQKEIDFQSIKKELWDSIIPFNKSEINNFLELLENNLKQDDILKELVINENFKDEIFKLSSNFSSLFDKIEVLEKKMDDLIGQTKLPKELNLIHYPISKVIYRNTELERLRKEFINNEHIVFLNGIGGIGKTTLAETYIQKYAPEYDHIVWINFNQSLEKSFISSPSLIHNLDILETNPNNLFEIITSKLSSVKGTNLLIIDGVDSDISQEINKLPNNSNWHILITSVTKNSLHKTIDIDSLSEQSSITLFKSYHKEFNNDQIKEIVNYIDHHPLVIEVLSKSAKRNRWTFEFTLKAITKNVKSNVNTHHSKTQIEDIKSYLADVVIINVINEKSEWLLNCLMALPSEYIHYDDLFKLLDVKNLKWCNTFSSEIENLYEAGYIQKNENSYKLHTIVNHVLKEIIPVQHNEITNIINGSINTIKMDPANDEPFNLIKYLPYVESIASFFSNEKTLLMAELYNFIGFLYNVIGVFNYEYFEKALDILNLNKSENEKNISYIESNLSSVYWNMGSHQKALFLLNKSQSTYLKNNDKKGFHINLSNMSVLYSEIGNYIQAEIYIKRALKFAKKNGSTYSISNRMITLGSIYLKKGIKNDDRKLILKSKSYIKKGLEYSINEPSPKSSVIAKQKSYLANTLIYLGEIEEAFKIINEAININIEHLNEVHSSKNNITLGENYVVLAQILIIKKSYEPAKEILKDVLTNYFSSLPKNHRLVKNTKITLAEISK